MPYEAKVTNFNLPSPTCVDMSKKKKKYIYINNKFRSSCILTKIRWILKWPINYNLIVINYKPNVNFKSYTILRVTRERFFTLLYKQLGLDMYVLCNQTTRHFFNSNAICLTPNPLGWCVNVHLESHTYFWHNSNPTHEHKLWHLRGSKEFEK
jgi:hypothetical protein